MLKAAVIALAVWMAFLILLGTFFGSPWDADKVGWVLGLGLPLGVMIEVVVLVPIFLIREARRGPPTGPQLVCTNCGSVLWGQWWNKSKGVYECRVCGHDTAGRMADIAPKD